MGKVVVTEFVSLDGVMEDPAGVEGTGLGSWTSEVGWGDGGDKFKYDETFGSEALLLGRGKRLFGEGGKKAFRLRDSKVVGDGVAILVFEQAGQ